MKFLQNNNHQAVNEMNRESKKYSQKPLGFVGIFKCDYKCVSVCGCVSVFVWVIVANYRVCMCAWHVVYVIVMVQTQHVVFTGYKAVGVSYFCYIILFLYV